MGRSEFVYSSSRPAWSAGRKVGAKRPLKSQQIRAIRFHLDREHRFKGKALLDLAIDSKLRSCDLVTIRIGDLVAGGEMRPRAMVIQQKTSGPVQFEIMADARDRLLVGLSGAGDLSRITLSPAGWIPLPISTPDDMRVLSLNGLRRLGSEARTWNPFVAHNKGVYHLQGDRKFARCANSALSHQDSKHGTLPSCRC